LWVLLVLDGIAALLWTMAHRAVGALGQLIYALRDRPMTAFAAFLVFSIVIYLPMRLSFDASSWLVPGHYPLPIQTSRILLYAGYFCAGVGAGEFGLSAGVLAGNGALAKRWNVWVGLAGCLLWRNPAYGLHPPQWADRLQFTPALVTRGLRSHLCVVQRGDDVHGPRGFPAL
jgi:hypothetical protein